MAIYQHQDHVRILSGPLASFSGIIEHYDALTQTVKVGVEIFGRKTVVDLPTSEIEKVDVKPDPPFTSLN